VAEQNLTSTERINPAALAVEGAGREELHCRPNRQCHFLAGRYDQSCHTLPVRW